MTRDSLGAEFDPELTADAISLAAAGAKPRVISALTRIKLSSASKIFAKVQGHSASPGQYADSFLRFVRTRHQHFHANYLYNIFSDLKQLGLSDAQVLLQANASYRDQFAGVGRTFDINEQFCLWTLLRNPDLTQSTCRDCGTRYFLAPFELAEDSATCPFCRMSKLKSEAGAGESKQLVSA